MQSELQEKKSENIRQMQEKDISNVLSLMEPFIKNGNLLPRTQEILKQTFSNYIVYELNEKIVACSALQIYDSNEVEIAGVAVNESFENIGIGNKMIKFLLERARQKKAKTVFVLTKNKSQWFEKFGFVECDVSDLPEKRRATYDKKRNSIPYRLDL